MVSWLRSLVVPAVLVVLISVAGLVLGGVYADDLLTRLVIGAAAGSVLVGVAARRLPSWLVAPLSVAGLVGYTALAMWLSARHTDRPGALLDITVDAVRNGIPRLLTAMIPVEPTPDTVVVPLVAAWLTGLAGTEVAMRTGRVLLSYLPAAAFYAGVLYVVGPNADRAIWPTVVFVAAAAIGLAVPARPAAEDAAVADLPPGDRAALRLRRTAGAAAGLAVVVALAAVTAPVLGGRDGAPVDPRKYVEPPVVDSLDESPLIRISGWALQPDQKLFDLTSTRTGAPPDAAGDDDADPPVGDGTDPGDDADPEQPTDPDAEGRLRLRLAVLNDYDGVTWKVGATYRNAGRILPTPPASPTATVDTVQQQIVIDGLSGQLLPAVSTPRQVTGARVAYDPGSGTLIRPEGLTPGVRYDVESVREHPDFGLLPAANVPAGDAVARVLAVPEGTPDQLRALAEQLASDNGAPYSRAAALEEFLAVHYRLVADAPSGHAYPNLRFFLFGPRNGGGQKGTSEQFAAAYAVLGRLMGLPTRVVVGFSSPTGNGPVRAGDAYAWPEVLFEDLGWVAFDPLPRPNTQPRPVEEDFKPKPEDPPPTPDQEPPSAEPTPSDTGAGPPVAAPDRGVPTPVLAGGGAGGMLLLAAGILLVLIMLRRAQTRRRLADGSPADRIAGAWWEVTDALRLAGRPPGPDLAATEVAAHAHAVATEPPPQRRWRRRGGATDVDAPATESTTARPGATEPDATMRPAAPSVDRLAGLVNRSAFAPDHTDADQARQAADDALAYTAALRERRSWWRRLWWSAHPGPLRWRR
ncbi:transglutaminaseTgpA domain-containing protein [Plantactinospora sp. GCM10030261]|uniref:transglutaminaseTgpA domain-containing protein n=1 Tax=Plantactinospora sp. GCM10030261 TaxID=3273420 RepID=UPI00360D0B83